MAYPLKHVRAMPTPDVAPPLSGLSRYETKFLRVQLGLNTAYSKRRNFSPMCPLRGSSRVMLGRNAEDFDNCSCVILLTAILGGISEAGPLEGASAFCSKLPMLRIHSATSPPPCVRPSASIMTISSWVIGIGRRLGSLFYVYTLREGATPNVGR